MVVENKGLRGEGKQLTLYLPFCQKNVQITFNVILLKWPHECSRSSNYARDCSECIGRERVYSESRRSSLECRQESSFPKPRLVMGIVKHCYSSVCGSGDS